MFKKIFAMIFMLSCFACVQKKDETIKIAAATYPMEEIVKIAATDLEKKGYKVEISVLTDYVTANKGLAAKDFDANFHQHEPFMKIFNEKNSANLVKVAPVYDVYVGFYSKTIKKGEELKNNIKVAIPNDPTNMDRALRILSDNGLITLKNTDKLVKVEDVDSNPKNIEFLPLPIPSLVQAYNEADLVFNWPAHMLKIGVSVKDALFLEKENGNRYAIILASREDNKDSKKIKDLKKAMTSEKVKKFLEDNYKEQGFPVF